LLGILRSVLRWLTLDPSARHVLSKLNVVNPECAQDPEIIVCEIRLCDDESSPMVAVLKRLRLCDTVDQLGGCTDCSGRLPRLSMLFAGIVKRLLQKAAISESIVLGIPVGVENRPVGVADVLD
jgi:hypothetical protein